MTLPRVSVVICCYQQAHLLHRALDSIETSNYPRDQIEAIVVDDGSTDDPAAVVGRYPGVRIVRRENGGLVAATNTGLEHAGGDFISFLDADDELHPDKLLLQAKHLLAHPEHGLVYCDLEVVDDETGRIDPSLHALFDPRSYIEGRALGRLLEQNFISAAQMIRASLRGLWAPIPAAAPSCQDWPLAVRIAQRWDVGVVRQPLYRYHRHGENMNLGIDNAKRERLLALEAPWRRWMFSELELDRASLPELIAAYEAFLPNASLALRLAGNDLDLGLPTSDDDRSAAARLLLEATALESEDPRAAAARLLAAIGRHPASTAANSAFKALAAACRAFEAQLELPAGAALVVCDALEAVEEPALLRALAGGIADDAAIVMLYPADDEPLIERLVSAIEAAGLDAEGAPELVAVASTALARADLAGRSRALISARAQPPDLSLAPLLTP